MIWGAPKQEPATLKILAGDPQPRAGTNDADLFGLNFQFELFRRVGTNFIQNERNIVSFGDKPFARALDGVPAVLFGFDDEQHLIHERSHSPGGTSLLERRHIENDVVEITRFKVRYEVEESLQTELRRACVRGSYFS